jgi:hypothetical protein
MLEVLVISGSLTTQSEVSIPEVLVPFLVISGALTRQGEVSIPEVFVPFLVISGSLKMHGSNRLVLRHFRFTYNAE